MEEVHPWVRDHRHEVEEAWVTEVMNPMGWLTIEAWSEDQVMIVGYEGTVNLFVVFAEERLIQEVGLAEVLFG